MASRIEAVWWISGEQSEWTAQSGVTVVSQSREEKRSSSVFVSSCSSLSNTFDVSSSIDHPPSAPPHHHSSHGSRITRGLHAMLCYLVGWWIDCYLLLAVSWFSSSSWTAATRRTVQQQALQAGCSVGVERNSGWTDSYMMSGHLKSTPEWRSYKCMQCDVKKSFIRAFSFPQKQESWSCKTRKWLW